MAKVWLINPKKRKSSKKSSSKKPKRRKSKRRGSVRKVKTFRRNPSPRGMVARVLENQVKPAATQAVGALAVDLAFGQFGRFLPVQLSTGMLRHVTKGVGAVILSTLASNFLNNSTANALARGALTVTIHDALKEVAATAMPSVPLGYFSPARIPGRGGMGFYPRGSRPALLPNTGVMPRQLGRARRRSSRGIGYYPPNEAEVFDTSAIE